MMMIDGKTADGEYSVKPTLAFVCPVTLETRMRFFTYWYVMRNHNGREIAELQVFRVVSRTFKNDALSHVPSMRIN